MVEGSKQVRVDNWGIFFLQRLQMFFSKTDYCDLTLQFEGNVQLKVHRLVMSACTEYFMYLEQTCPAMEDNTIMMPPDLQADVIVPIVNFMYTGMLEFHMSIFDRLYKAAELMSITVLTKLLDAQKTSLHSYKSLKKKTEPQPTKRASPKTVNAPELPAPLPGRKLPVWKRRNVPAHSVPHPTSQLQFAEQKIRSQDPLSLDNAPKPTRFEWPDDDLPPISLMDTSFEDISYTSKPLLTQEEERKASASTSFDEVRSNAASVKKSGNRMESENVNMKDVEDYVKQQKIRNDLPASDEGQSDSNETGQKRRLEQAPKSSPKRLRSSDKENKEATISIKAANGTDLDHTKIVSEILKKYPELVKKNKNIRLKIMAGGNKARQEQQKVVPVQLTQNAKPQAPKIKIQPEAANKLMPKKAAAPASKEKFNEEGPWTCQVCAKSGESPQEFVLYYLYRKHMTDIHNEMFDFRMCKYCGRKCGKHNYMMYHLYTKHGLKPPSSYNFPKCDQCPYIALSAAKLQAHKQQHGANEMQCVDCKLAFTNQQMLTAHIQITGHFTKPGKASFDCQYCTKKLQSAINLFSHIKNSHLKEARRDGIVSLDELDDVDECEDEDEEEEEEQEAGEEEYILPEVLTDSSIQKDKVKIISNVKVPVRPNQIAGDQAQAQSVTLEPSSEAEALSNVASGIATSLGLVDIVVLDDNQQYILQQEENQDEQSEFILPEMPSGGNPFGAQVIATTQHSSVIQQGMLQTSGTDITSTDELVMVLTDHDYQEDQEGETTDNSNIVVLYSHPVDGQQGQFITSQGNLLVNSQTGMLELRNGTAIATTTANQIVVNNSNDTPIETIEMIQREIENHSDLKQEPFYEEEHKPEVNQELQQELQDQEQPQEEEEEVEEREQENQNEEKSAEIERETVVEDREVVKNVENDGKGEDNVDSNSKVEEEPMETEEIKEAEEQPAQKDQEVSDEVSQKNSETVEKITEEPPKETTVEKNSEEERGVDIPPDLQTGAESINMYETSESVITNDPNIYRHDDDGAHEDKDKEERKPEEENVPEPMEVDSGAQDKEEDNTPQEKTKDEEESEERNEESGETQENATQQNEEGNADDSAEQPRAEEEATKETPEVQEEKPEPTEEPHRELAPESTPDLQQIDVVGNQYEEDENSQSSQGTSQSDSNRNQANINQAILEDWEDTDSQQSEKQRVAMKEAAENVNKLMDDWEEEDDEDDKKETE